MRFGARLQASAIALAGIVGVMVCGREAESQVVNCLDRERGVVMRTRAIDCRGEVVSNAEAEQRRTGREAYLRGAFEAPPVPEAPTNGDRPARIGTGFFIDPSHVLTNDHVVRECRNITVEPAAGGGGPARLQRSDRVEDLALLRTETEAPSARFSNGPEIDRGEPVTVIGYPSRTLPPLSPETAAGHVFQRIKLPNGSWRYAVNVLTRPGSSGSPVLDRLGRVVGIVSAKVDQTAVYKRTGHTMPDVGIVVPANVVTAFLRNSGVEPRLAVGAAAAESELVTAVARASFVTRVLCWP